MIKLKINGLFSLNLETLFTKHSPPETLSLSLEKKALYFKWNFLKLSTISNFIILRESDRGESDVIYSLV